MSNSLAQTFDHFRDAIEMKPELKSTITVQETRLREGLQKRWPSSTLFFSGSFGRKTKIEPISDVDIFMVRPEQYREIGRIPISQEQLLNEVTAEVRLLFPHHTIRLQTRSLGIVLPQFRIDLVPAFSRTGGGYFIPDRSPGTPNWRFTHPDKQLEFTKSVHQATGQMAIPLVKMVKVWNRNRHVGLKSYHVEVLVLRALSGKPSSYAEGLRTVFERLEHAIKRPCGDPGESGGTLDTYLDAHTRARASEEAKRAAAQMTEALGLVTLKREAEAIRLVADLMGPSFPRG